MTDWNEAERIYAKLHKEGDITWKESDVIFKILHDRIFSRTYDLKEYNKSKEFLKKWFDRILFLTGRRKKGIFLHTIIHNLKERYWNVAYKGDYVEEMFLIDDIGKNIRKYFLLEEKDKAVILTFKNKDEVSKFLNKKISRNLAGRKYQKFDYRYNYSLTGSGSYSKEMITDRYDKYFFEIYRPMTLTRIGFDDYVKLDIDDDFFKAACTHYGKNRKVTDVLCVYERTIEIMLDMEIPMYACSTFPYDEISRAKFDMLVHKDYAEEVSTVFNVLPHVVDKNIFSSGIYKYDNEFSNLIAGVIRNYIYKEEKEKIVDDDSWMAMER